MRSVLSAGNFNYFGNMGVPIQWLRGLGKDKILELRKWRRRAHLFPTNNFRPEKIKQSFEWAMEERHLHVFALQKNFTSYNKNNVFLLPLDGML